MSNISSIRLSGTTYSIKDASATTVVSLTQAQYDALVTKDPNTLYNITDAQGADLSQYYTSAQTESAITQAISGKVYTSSVVTAVTSASTDNEIPTAKAVYDAIPTGGTSITIDPTLDSGSTNPVANSAITTSVNEKQFKRRYVGCDVGDTVFLSTDSVVVDGKRVSIMKPMFRGYANNSTNTGLELQNVNLGLYFTTINGKNIFNTSINGNWITEVIETSAITTSISSSSTDAQVPSAKAVHDQLGGLSIVKLTESEYAALVTKDSDTLYCVVPDPSN